MILPCTCYHQFQDKEHGLGMRVCNKVGDPNKPNTYRCTVCKTEVKGKVEPTPPKKKK